MTRDPSGFAPLLNPDPGNHGARIEPCAACQDHIAGWAATAPSTHIRPGLAITSHGSGGDTHIQAVERRGARWRAWSELVDFQIRLTLRICAEQHQVAAITPLPEPEPWGQYDLFGMAS